MRRGLARDSLRRGPALQGNEARRRYRAKDRPSPRTMTISSEPIEKTTFLRPAIPRLLKSDAGSRLFQNELQRPHILFFGTGKNRLRGRIYEH